MQIKTRVLISHKEYTGNYINRGSNGLTTDLDAAITFKDEGEASEWLLNCRYAPENKECYTYKRIKITKEVLEDESVSENC
jgi:hypothetical protein